MLEMMVAVFLIGVLAAVILPRAIGRAPEASWQSVLADLNNILSFARQEAIMQRKNYRVTFIPKGKGRDVVLVEEEKATPDDARKKVFEQVSSGYFDTKYLLPDGIKIRSFYLGNQFVAEEENRGKYFCYILPDGLVQDVTLHLHRPHQDQAKKKDDATFNSMPFLGIFTMRDGYIKPSVRGGGGNES